ncbi:MAG: dTDP-4-amino-4,6-dideoxygalactose transaminase [Leptospirales bacterium]
MIRFNIPNLTGNELEYLHDVVIQGHFSGDGAYTKKSSDLLQSYLNVKKVLITHSCTAALEMCAILLDIGPGDEIIMPSFTFVSTANAFTLRGGVPVFIDIRLDTLNIDEGLIEAAITPRTKAIVVVHYAGVSCELTNVLEIARKYNLAVIEDAAQGLGSSYKGGKLGTFGDMATISFHETKNIISGEGGALVINNPRFFDRAEIIREKGTNRSKFLRGETDKYTWVDIGSSYLPSELVASFLYAQLECIDQINSARMKLWKHYESLLANQGNFFRIPKIPPDCGHNAHIFYILTHEHIIQDYLLRGLNTKGIKAVFHYVPLHSSIAGQKYGRCGSKMNVTDYVSSNLIRLPLYPMLKLNQLENICRAIFHLFDEYKSERSEPSGSISSSLNL